MLECHQISSRSSIHHNVLQREEYSIGSINQFRDIFSEFRRSEWGLQRNGYLYHSDRSCYYCNNCSDCLLEMRYSEKKEKEVDHAKYY